MQFCDHECSLTPTGAGRRTQLQLTDIPQMVGNIAPRPLLLLHAANDSVTPTEQSIEMFKRAGQPADLILLSDVDHFTFSENNPRVRNIVGDWLATYFSA